MAKTISSIPGAEKFRSIIVIIIVLICITLFLVYTNNLSNQAEIVARNQVEANIRYSLSMMLYDHTIKGQQQALIKFDQGNPFIPLAIYRSLPLNYQGEVEKLAGDAFPGWYFEKDREVAAYVGLDNQKMFYRMRYVKDETTGLGLLELLPVNMEK